jgi:hypothetical protein
VSKRVKHTEPRRFWTRAEMRLVRTYFPADVDDGQIAVNPFDHLAQRRHQRRRLQAGSDLIIHAAGIALLPVQHEKLS